MAAAIPAIPLPAPLIIIMYIFAYLRLSNETMHTAAAQLTHDGEISVINYYTSRIFMNDDYAHEFMTTWILRT